MENMEGDGEANLSTSLFPGLIFHVEQTQQYAPYMHINEMKKRQPKNRE